AGESAGSRRARACLAVTEIALAMVLLTAAGLLIHSFSELTSVNPGFEPNHVVKAMVSLPQFQYATPKQWAAFTEELMMRLAAQPGMQDSAIAGPLPMVDCCITLAFQIVGNPPRQAGMADTVRYIHDVSLGKEPGPMLYVPFAQAPLYGGEVVVKSTLSTSAVVGAIRAVTRGMDKNLPVTDIAPLADVLSASVAQPRFRTLLLGLFRGIALILAGVGILGVIAYSVSR